MRTRDLGHGASAARSVRARRLTLAASALLLGCGSNEAPPIVLIVVDTLRQDHVSSYGGNVDTPNMDRLAAQGVVWRNAWSSFHQTTMSMGAMLTGRVPSLETGDGAALPFTGRHWCGLARFAASEGRDSCIPRNLDTLAEKLRSAGYWTAGVVSNRLLYRPAGFDQGFDHWRELAPLRTKRTQAVIAARSAGAVLTAARVALRKRPHDRVFLYLHFLDVHEHPAVRPRITYRRSVATFDLELGRLLDLLESEAWLADAVVIFTSDHGERMNEPHAIPGRRLHSGNPSFEKLLRVPLITRGGSPTRTDRWVRSHDLPGLVFELAGLSQTPPDPVLEPDEQFVSEIGFRTYRRGRWKSMFAREGDTAVLFDVVADPLEQIDLARSRPEILETHRRRIDELSAGPLRSRNLQPRVSREDEARLRALGYLEPLE